MALDPGDDPIIQLRRQAAARRATEQKQAAYTRAVDAETLKVANRLEKARAERAAIDRERAKVVAAEQEKRAALRQRVSGVEGDLRARLAMEQERQKEARLAEAQKIARLAEQRKIEDAQRQRKMADDERRRREDERRRRQQADQARLRRK